MRYSTPTYPVYRSAGTRQVNSGPYPGPYPVFVLAGYAAGVPVPNPAPPLPKPGHWRTSPRQAHKMAPKGRGAQAVWPCNIGPKANLDEPNASLRARVREAVACGAIAPADAPAWAQPR